MKQFKKVFSVIVGMLATIGIVAFNVSPTIQVQAALTEPVGYDWKYKPVLLAGEYTWFSQSVGQTAYQVGYTRTADGSYSNYVATIDDTTGLPSGMSIQLTFNRSTTSWDYNGFDYFPISQYIGSNNTVGTLTRFDVIFNNTSNHDYNIIYDMTSTTGEFLTQIYYNQEFRYHYTLANTLIANNIYIPAYEQVKMIHFTDSQSYLDAIYLDDLGVSAAYTAGHDVGLVDGYDNGYDDGYFEGSGDGYDVGYDVGYNDGYDVGYLDADTPSILLQGFATLAGIATNFVLLILNLQVFDVSLLSIFGVFVGIALVLWLFKVIRG